MSPCFKIVERGRKPLTCWQVSSPSDNNPLEFTASRAPNYTLMETPGTRLGAEGAEVEAGRAGSVRVHATVRARGPARRNRPLSGVT